MAVRPFAALAGAAVLTLGLVTVPPATAASLPRTEVHAVHLVAITAPAAPTSVARPAAASQTADDTTSTTPPDFLAFAAEILAYLNSLGLGAGPGLAAIGLSGLVVAFAATAYAWNGFANTVNPGLRFLRVPRVPKFPVCFAGQICSSSAPASASARVIKPASSAAATPAGRGVGTSKRVASTNDGKNTAATKVHGTKKSTPSAASAAGKGGSKRARTSAAH
ncbi:conserved exported hypothetical protein [uncultured Mycobacterium sp.]|uniref:Uncharacterized protein n=1 Tax=uncultured Mycobacterium sp. TaxID=171292 RepID=A0A1Y5PLC1_9MYCO|nr:conserved exported hypothetical protein [uncultured Mycobacterium sp.]